MIGSCLRPGSGSGWRVAFVAGFVGFAGPGVASASPFVFNDLVNSRPGSNINFLGSTAWINDLDQVMLSVQPVGQPFGLHITDNGQDFTLLRGSSNVMFGFIPPQNLTNSGLAAFVDNNFIRINLVSPTGSLVFGDAGVGSENISVNDAGQVAFTNNNRVLTTFDGVNFEDRGSNGSNFTVWLNNRGQVSSFGGADDSSIVRSDPGGTRTTLVDTNGFGGNRVSSITPFRKVLRDQGDVLFRGVSATVRTTPNGDMIADQGQEGLFLSDGSVVTPLVTLDDGFTSISRDEFAINESGMLVFIATPTDGNRGLFATDGDSIWTILEEGDAFMGSTVALSQGFFRGLTITNDAINEGNVVAFHYRLADGFQGVATVVVPAPGSLVLLAAAALPTLRRRRSR